MDSIGELVSSDSLRVSVRRGRGNPAAGAGWEA